MKKIFKTMMLAMVASLSVAMVSCSDDDDEVPAASSQVVGKYAVSSSSQVMRMMDSAVDSGDGEVEIVAVTDSTVDVYLPATTTSVTRPGSDRTYSYEIGGMTVKGVKVVATAAETSPQTYLLSHDSFDAQAGQYEVTGGKLEGSVYNGKVNIKITYKPGSMPFDLVTIFASK